MISHWIGDRNTWHNLRSPHPKLFLKVDKVKLQYRNWIQYCHSSMLTCSCRLCNNRKLVQQEKCWINECFHLKLTFYIYFNLTDIFEVFVFLFHDKYWSYGNLRCTVDVISSCSNHLKMWRDVYTIVVLLLFFFHFSDPSFTGTLYCHCVHCLAVPVFRDNSKPPRLYQLLILYNMKV